MGMALRAENTCGLLPGNSFRSIKQDHHLSSERSVTRLKFDACMVCKSIGIVQQFWNNLGDPIEQWVCLVQAPSIENGLSQVLASREAGGLANFQKCDREPVRAENYAVFAIFDSRQNFGRGRFLANYQPTV